MIGRILQALHAPGFIRPWKYYDAERKMFIHITTSRYFTVLHVNGMDFYFYRENGKYDGWGRHDPPQA